MPIRTLTPLALYLSLLGCANPEIVQVSPNTYLLSKQDRAGIFGNAGALKANVIKQANEFAQGQGKIAIPVSSKETPLAPGRFAQFEYQFRVADPKDPDVQQTALTPEPDLIIERRGKNNGETRGSKLANDLYSELIKLGDLHKRGILTDAEFEAQKQKVLQSQ